METSLYLGIELISICNFKCFFCDARIMEKENKKIMSIETLKNILDDCKTIGITHLNITPSTGELFLDNEIYDKLKLIKQYNFKEIKFVTNGSVLDVEKLKESIDERFKISISYYGINGYEEFNHLTQKNINFYTKVESCIKELKNKDIPFKLLDRSLKGHLYTTENKDDTTLDEKYRFDQRGKEFKFQENKKCSNIFYPRIDVLGNFIFCSCSNPFHKIFKEQIIGNININKLVDLYFSSTRLSLIKNFLKKDIPLFCENCDSYNKVGDIPLNRRYIKEMSKIDNSNRN